MANNKNRKVNITERIEESMQRGFDEGISHIVYEVGRYYLGYMMLKHIEFSSVVMASTFWATVPAIVTGAAITLIPYFILSSIIDRTFKENRPWVAFALNLALILVNSCVDAMIGSMILGLAANPITLCALAGTSTLCLLAMGIHLLAHGIQLIVTCQNDDKGSSAQSKSSFFLSYDDKNPLLHDNMTDNSHHSISV